MAPSFGNFGTTNTSFASLASISGLSTGTVEARSPTNYQYAAQDKREVAKTAYSAPRPNTMASTARPVPVTSVKRTTQPRLTLGGMFPATGARTASGATLSYPASIPSTGGSSSRFSLSGFLSGLSMGTPVAPAKVQAAYSAPRPNTMASTARPVAVAEVQTTRQDGSMDMIENLWNAAASKLQQSKGQVFGGGQSNGGGAGLQSISGTDALIAGGAGIALIALFASRGKAPRKTSTRRKAPRRSSRR